MSTTPADSRLAGPPEAAHDEGRLEGSQEGSPFFTTARLSLALALLAGGGLLLEIALTRVLSVLFFSTYSYLVLSLAVLGLAVGSAAATLLPATRWPSRWSLWASLAGASGLALALHSTTAAGSEFRLLLLPLTLVPYLFLGLAIAGIFAVRSAASPRLYLADLSGAAAGALLAVPLLDAFGGHGAMLAAALAPALAGLLLAPRRPFCVVTVLLTTAALLLQAGGAGPAIDLSELATPKPIRESLREGAEVVETRWNAFARTDLVRFEGRERFLIYLDGGAGSLVPNASRPNSWLGDIGALAFAVAPAERVFLIGPGGGLDIALARAFEAEELVAAEINAAAVELTRSLEAHAGDLYGEKTEVFVDDGRSALRRYGGEYDLILLSQVVSGAAEVRGLALVENGLYTTEAFGTYLDHLTAEGRIALKLYDELTLTRALTTAIATLTERGVPQTSAVRHLFAALDTRADPPVPLLIVDSRPLSESRAIDWAREAEARGFALLFVPGLLAPPPLQAVLEGAAGLEAVTGMSDGLDLRPTSDRRPFFYQFEKGLPRALRPLAWGVGVLLVVLVLAATGWRLRRGRELLLAPTVAAALGSGFMLVEIGMLQRAQLLIGHPALTLATVLAALLLGAAAGSGLADRCPRGREYLWMGGAGVTAAVLAFGWSALWPLASQLMRGLPAAGAAAGSALTVLPLALALGFPFPLLLRAVGRHGPAEVATAWTINGAASVAGAVAATALALVWGFGSVAAAAVVCYGLMALLAGLAYLRS